MKSRTYIILVLAALPLLPSRGQAQFEDRKEETRSPFEESRLKAEINRLLQGNTVRTPTTMEYAEAERRIAAENGSRLLSSSESRGWSYAEIGGHRSLDISPDYSNSAGASQFVLVRRLHGDLTGPFSYYDSQPPMNVIRVQADPGWQKLKLGPFFSVNNRLLRDFPSFLRTAPSTRNGEFDTLALPKISPTTNQLAAYSNDALAITIADLGSGQSAVTIFSLKESAEVGGLRGDMFVVRDDMTRLEVLLQEKLGSQSFSIESSAATDTVDRTTSRLFRSSHELERPVKRVFVYGSGGFVPKIVESCGGGNCEVVCRSSRANDLYVLNTRLDALSGGKVLNKGFAVVNGIPDDEKSFSHMGHFAGDFEAWLSYRKAVSGILASYKHAETTTWDSLATELTQGESDALFLFAHSNGSADLFLGDQPVSLKTIQALPDRHEERPRPRVAILFSCNTGRDPRIRWSISDWRDGKEIDQLAQILVKKGFFDKVLAPNHAFGPEEGVGVLQSLLMGDNRPLGADGWVNWALATKKLGGPEV